MKDTAKKVIKLALPALMFAAAFLAVQLLSPGSKQTGSQLAFISDGDASKSPGVSVGDVVDLPELPSLESGTVSLKSSKHDYTLLALFSVTCPGCAKDADVWVELKEEAARRNVGFYLINTDSERERIRRFALAYGFETLPILFDPELKAVKAFKSSIVPQYLLVSAEGRIIARWDGVRQAEGEQERRAAVAEFFEPLLR